MTGKAKHWSLVNSSGCPTARSGHCATVARDALYVFGGCGHPAAASSATAASGGNVDAQLPAEALPICLGDLHIYDLARQRWSEVRPPARAADSASEEPRPAERTCAAMCASEGEDAEDRLFLSGGAGDDPYDLRGCCWEFCVRRRAWRLLFEGGSAAPSAAPETMSPCRRIGHTMVHDSTRNRLVIFGGSTGKWRITQASSTGVMDRRFEIFWRAPLMMVPERASRMEQVRVTSSPPRLNLRRILSAPLSGCQLWVLCQGPLSKNGFLRRRVRW